MTDEQINILTNEYEILHLIYHRSKNQHRQQVWFKHLSILNRKLRSILKLLYDTQIKKTLHKSNQILEVIKYLVAKKVFKRCFYEFHGIVALGQYINLGFALLGSISKIYCLLIDFEGVRDYMNVQQIQVMKEELQDEDEGEVVEFETIEMEKMPIVEDIPTKGKKRSKDSAKKKKKKKKSAMDDIFG